MSGLAIFARKIGRKWNRETLSRFECGFDSKHFGRTSFSINFCIFLILFLVFDIELVFFFHLPMFMTQERRVMLFLFLLVGRFIFGGFLYEEKNMAWI
jgi:NADH:ubiquinone oxidoreductase subunit 3 (subunit A)